MKPARQSLILEIITERDIETQNDLMEALAERGVKSTQATLSRDIKDMHLLKKQIDKEFPLKNRRRQGKSCFYLHFP